MELETRLTRRAILRGLGVGALVGPAATLLSACGPQVSTAAKPTAPAAQTAPNAAPGAATLAPASTGGPRPGGTFNWYLPDDPPDLDPHMQTTSSLQWVSGMVYNGLLKYDIRPGNTPDTSGASTPIPDLAESWEQPDPLTYVFHLRRGVLFHDGAEVTADDAAFSLDRIRTNKPEFQRSYAFEPVDSAQAADRYTLRVTMKAPYAPFINQVAAAYTRIAPRAEIEKLGDLKQTMIGTGPFKLKEYSRGNRFVLERNPNYFGAPLPYLDSINIRVLPDQSAQLAAFNAHQLDAYQPSNIADFNNLKQSMPGIGSLKFQDMQVNGIGFNVTQKPFDDIRVRQALWYAVDQDEIIKLAWQGEAYKHRAVPPSLTGWAVPYEQLPLSDSPNLDKARQLLSDAGYPNGLDFECKTVYRYTQKEAQVVSEQLKRINVNMKILDVEYGAFLNARNTNDFQAIAFSLAPFGDVEDFTYSLFKTTSSRNYGKWGNSDLDQQLEAARQEVDVDKRKALYRPIQEELARQCYLLDVPRGFMYEVWQPNVKDFVSTANPERGLAYHYVWLDKA
ncbi:MAG TPA: ABC transporter substrate-binding protein [Chloroflexota bacterium]